MARFGASGYDREHALGVTQFTIVLSGPGWGVSLVPAVAPADRGALMASSSLEPRSARELPWNACSRTSGRSYMLAAMRAGLIALALLGVLALIVLF